MIKRYRSKYYCDLCGKEVKKFHSKVEFYDYAFINVRESIDICKECNKTFWKTFKKMRKILNKRIRKAVDKESELWGEEFVKNKYADYFKNTVGDDEE